MATEDDEVEHRVMEAELHAARRVLTRSFQAARVTDDYCEV
jgi:hypothetical protein